MWTLGQCWINVFIWIFLYFLRWTTFGELQRAARIQRTIELASENSIECKW